MGDFGWFLVWVGALIAAAVAVRAFTRPPKPAKVWRLDPGATPVSPAPRRRSADRRPCAVYEIDGLGPDGAPTLWRIGHTVDVDARMARYAKDPRCASWWPYVVLPCPARLDWYDSVAEAMKEEERRIRLRRPPKNEQLTGRPRPRRSPPRVRTP